MKNWILNLLKFKKKITAIKVLIFLETNVKSYVDEDTDFCDKEIPKMDSNHTWLVAINLDS